MSPSQVINLSLDRQKAIYIFFTNHIFVPLETQKQESLLPCFLKLEPMFT